MGLPANVFQQQTCGLGSAKGGPSTTSATGAHSAMLRGAIAARSSAPTEATVLSRPALLNEGARKGPSL
eukprot:6602059-Pyramimonas_sp.AAC.1